MRNKNQCAALVLTFSLVFIFFSGRSLSALGSKDASKFSVKGYVLIMGSEPHTYVGFRSEDGTGVYRISPETAAKKLAALQGHLLEITVRRVPDQDQSVLAGHEPEVVSVLSWKVIE